jgi:hypothetical protein
MTDVRAVTRVLVHPIAAWRRLSAELIDHADAEARAAGLAVKIGPSGLRRYRDPRMDRLATRHLIVVEASEQLASDLTSDVLNAAGGWSR